MAALYMLIDVTEDTKTKLERIAPMAQIIEWAKLYKADGKRVLAPPISGAGFSVLNGVQLQYCCWNTFQLTPVEAYGKLIEQCNEAIKSMTIDQTPLAELTSRVSMIEPAADSSDAIKKQSQTAKKAERQAANPTGRPKTGTATGAVWDICDELFAKSEGIPARPVAIAACVEEGINQATASTQYGKWKKSK